MEPPWLMRVEVPLHMLIRQISKVGKSNLGSDVVYRIVELEYKKVILA